MSDKLRALTATDIYVFFGVLLLGLAFIAYFSYKERKVFKKNLHLRQGFKPFKLDEFEKKIS